MATIHFLNVKEGDCSVIEHNSGHASVIDVCNAKPVCRALEALLAAKSARGISGNFQQKKHPVNPISYLNNHGIKSVFRYIQTHPDMDHMDGIEAFFEEFSPINFWDTDNKKKMETGWDGSPYSESDWKFYKKLRDTSPSTDPKRLTLLSGAKGQYFNVGEDGSGGGDGLQVLAPTQKLVDAANDADQDYNRCSYVLLYKTGDSRIVFGGDSHDETWEHILEHHEAKVTDIDLLIAPHHGRKSGRSYEFLDTLSSTLTFFGNARSENLAYSAWQYRGLSVVTNNQANCMVVDASTTPMTLYVTHENYAKKVNADSWYSSDFQAWYVGPITDDLIPPSAEDVAGLTEKIARRITKRVRKLVEEEESFGTRLEETALGMESSLLSAMRVPVPDTRSLFESADEGSGDHEGESTGESPGTRSPRLCTKVAGFSLHAGRSVDAGDRDGLERLCRYGLRAPFSQERLSLAEDGRVVYRLPRPWPNSAGVTHLVLEGTELLARLAALIPAPYLNMTRYHGVFSSRSKWRSRLPAPRERREREAAAAVDEVDRSEGTEAGSASSSVPSVATSPPPCRRQWMPWSALLARVFYLNALLCPKCGGKRKVLAFLTDPSVVEKILAHVGLETRALPLVPARTGEGDLRLWEWEEGKEEWDESDGSGSVDWDDSWHEGDSERGPP